VSTYGWQSKIKVTVPATGNIDVPLPDGRPTLEKCTIWATGGARLLEGLTFQAKLNGINFGSSVAHVGPARFSSDVFRSGDGAADAFILPTGIDDINIGDPWDFVMNITSTLGSDQEVTLYFVGIGHAGG
jgi:hypothetical protein